MTGIGRVIGGEHLGATVTTAVFGSDVVIQTGIKGRRITLETVKSWQEIPVKPGNGGLSAVGKAAAGAALPGRFGKAASAAVGAALDAKQPPHTVRVDWLDGKQSLLRIPADLFTHLSLVLVDVRIPSDAPDPAAEPPAAAPTMSEQAFSLVAGLVKERFPARNAPATPPVSSAPPLDVQVDLAEQLTKLASLRDAGILTEEEFTTKKLELLSRL